MLLKMDTLRAIERGDITLAFRRWKRPSVKAGGQLKTAVGVLSIRAVDPIDDDDIDDAEARRSGHSDREALIEALRGRAGTLYRIELAFAGPDPRIALRQRDQLSDAEWDDVLHRLDRMDRASRTGPWTTVVLALIDDRPGVRAPDLAALLGQPTQPFKRRVRRLKALGLTESLDIGYRLSPRGRAVLGRRHTQ